MPRVFAPEMDEEADIDDEQLDDESRFRVSPDAFQYLPPPDLGGPKGPVYVPVVPGAPPPAAPKRGLFDGLLGRRPEPIPPSEAEKKETQTVAELAARMAALGAVRAYARYDGGHDEGFAWFDHCVFADGSVKDARQMAGDLEKGGGATFLQAVWNQPIKMQSALDDFLASYWAIKLLGEGYGTGEYLMYGAFSVDLRSGLVSDDIKPDPIVQNIQFES
ncbi:MAG TPA: hypothetical protein VGO52_27240 [Hyphomonadaceae bacterium]|jgi:hypothetical protein|nr:hypothetical protein [Hyphomonadaceae bacterium]